MTQTFNALHPRVSDGTFTSKNQSEPAVALAPGTPVDRRLRSGADALIAMKLKTAAADELGTLERRAEKRGVPDELLPQHSPLTERVAGWDSLDSEGRLELFKDAGLKGHAHLLDNLEFTSNRVEMPEDVVVHLSDEDMVIVHQANKLIEETNLPGEITLLGVSSENAEFMIDHGGVKLRMRLGDRIAGFSAYDDEDDYDYSGWMDRADAASYGELFGYEHAARGVDRNFKDVHSYAILFQEMKASKFEDHSDVFEIIDAHNRTAELKVDDETYTLNISETPSITVGRTQVHQSMVGGLLDHVASESTGTDGKTFASDLGDVMRKTRERIAILDAQ